MLFPLKKIPTFPYWTSCLIFFATQIYGFSQKLNFSSNILILAFRVLRVGKTVCFVLRLSGGGGLALAIYREKMLQMI